MSVENFEDNNVDSGDFVNPNTSQTPDAYPFISKVEENNNSNFGLSMGTKKIIMALLLVLLFSLIGLFLYETITGLFLHQTNPTPVTSICGNGICEVGENSINCPQDCITNITQVNFTGGLKLVSPIVKPSNASAEDVYINDYVNFYVHVEKLGQANVSRVWVILTSPSGKLETVELSDNGVWEGSAQVKEGGSYLVTFNAVDESRTFAEQVNIAFLVRAVIFPITTAFGITGLPPVPY